MEDISVKKMWCEYLKTIGESVDETAKKYTSWYFCDNEYDANMLADLVASGIKRGTTSLYELYEIEKADLPKVGDYSVIINWNGIAECLVRIKKVTILPFKDVTEELAHIEGEGDKSLNYWQRVHIDFFTREAKGIGKTFTPDDIVVFEEFEVVYK